MKVIPPLDITDALLTSSTIAEPDTGETAWSGSSVSYGLDAEVIRSTTHKVYRCVLAHTSAASPLPENDGTHWQEVGPTNQRAMFDLLRNTASTTASPLTVVITPGRRVNSLAVLGAVATGIEVTVTSSAVEVYSYEENLSTREVLSWRDYFFEEFGTKPSVILFDLPPFTNAVITITLTNSTGDVSCGACVVGNYVDIGQVQAEAESDVLNFSSVERDFDGEINTMVQRRNVPKTVQNILLPKPRVNKVRALRDSLNGTPAVWAGMDNSASAYFEAVLILGFYRRFSINLRHATHAVIGLELEEI